MLCGSKSFENVGIYLARFLALQYAKQHGDYCRQNLGQHLALVTDRSCELGLQKFLWRCMQNEDR
jgi:hypothetical protein